MDVIEFRKKEDIPSILFRADFVAPDMLFALEMDEQSEKNAKEFCEGKIEKLEVTFTTCSFVKMSSLSKDLQEKIRKELGLIK